MIDTVTLQVEPLFALHARETAASLDEVLDGHDELTASNDHVDVHWWTHTRRVLLKRNNRVPLDGSRDALRPLSRTRRWWDDDLLANDVFGAVVGAGPPGARAWSARSPGRRRTRWGRASSPTCRTGCSPPSGACGSSRWSTRCRGPSWCRWCASWSRRWRPAAGGSPCRSRSARPQPIPSPCRRRTGATPGYVAAHVAPGSPDQDAFFGTLERLAGQVGGRPHWGKVHGLDAATLRERYPRFDDVVALRDRLDPGGVLGNAHLDRVLGAVPDRTGPGATAP